MGLLSEGFESSSRSALGPFAPYPRRDLHLPCRSHDSAHPDAVLAPSQGVCANRDHQFSYRGSDRTPPHTSAVCTAHGVRRAPRITAHAPCVQRAQVRADRRDWVLRTGHVPARMPVWTSQNAWLDALRTWAHTGALGAVCTAHRVSMTAPTLLAVAAVMAEHADHATGRNVAVTRTVIAHRIGCDPRTVTTAWRILRGGGWALEVHRGHGSPATPSVGRRPSIYHLICPRRPVSPVVEFFYLPPTGGPGRATAVGLYSPSARTRAPKTRFSLNKQRRCRARPRPQPRPLAIQRLAAGLVARCYGLDQIHIGVICDALTANDIDPAVWSARTICDRLNADMKHTGQRWPDHIHHPAAFLAHRLRRITQPPTPPPTTAVPRPTTGDQPSSPPQPPNTPPTSPPRPKPPKLPEPTAAQHARIAAAKTRIHATLTRKHQPAPAPAPEHPVPAKRAGKPAKPDTPSSTPTTPPTPVPASNLAAAADAAGGRAAARVEAARLAGIAVDRRAAAAMAETAAVAAAVQHARTPIPAPASAGRRG